MAYAMTKRGSADNIVTYEFICDTVNDMNAIENKYKTIGSVAIVLSGDNGDLEVYICNSNKQWNSFGVGSGASSSSSSTESSLPTPPTSNGDYILKVSVNNDTATYSWTPLANLLESN